MTLREFLDIFLDRKNVIFTIVGAGVLCSIIYYRLQLESYNVTFLISVVRTEGVATPDDQYDQFYRLQADERFADTLVRYLSTEVGRRAVIARADLSATEKAYLLGHDIEATRLTSQLITVTLNTRLPRNGNELVRAVTETLNQYTASLNREARESHWFAVVSSEPVISDARITWREASLIGFLVGSFIAFWVVLFQHALSPPPSRTDGESGGSPHPKAIM